MTRLLVYFLLNMAGSFLCSLSEAALLASSEARIRLRVEAGQRGAQRLLALKQRPGRALSTIVFMNNMFLILGTALITTEAAGVFTGGGAMATFIVVQTVLMIFFTELLPKVIGQSRPEAIAAAVAPGLAFMTRLLWPIVFLVEHALDWVRPRGSAHRPGQEGEIVELARMGRDVGHLDAAEAELIHRVFRLDDITAWDVMTPRFLVHSFAASQRVGEARKALLETAHSQFPVFDKDLDNVTGILVLRDALAALARGEEGRTLGELAKPAVYLPSTRTVDDVLRDMQAAHGRMGVVVDEYGVTQGVLTMDDLVEELVGEAIDAKDLAQGFVKRLSRTSALVHGLNRVSDVARFLNVPLALDTPEEESNTVTGLLQDRLGRIPQENDKLELPGGLDLTVQAADARMATRVLAVHRPPSPPT
jgi:CBS domain containing-hemolysin-like protein